MQTGHVCQLCCFTAVSSVAVLLLTWSAMAFAVLVQLRAADGVLVPGGFGNRGVEGKILAAQYARENKVPYLGICLGMQVRSGMVVKVSKASAWPRAMVVGI